jgi:hypothetical protein
MKKDSKVKYINLRLWHGLMGPQGVLACYGDAAA